ncbi:MarR family winged helix-turn-helix transcriptional regulator [Vibrio sp. HN007]|uniref:MarR family winged helix-turn-helix transcriptional regulator n=1 Tax=Vibrio iocasae TaxID=3098914 RepID=UPI0035D3F19D
MKKRRDPLSRQIAILYRQEQGVVSSMLSEYNISFSELPFVMELYSKQGVTQEYLAQKVQVDKANAARSLKQLEKKELITRQSSPNDARAKLVYLTDNAIALKSDLVAIIDRWNELLTRDITDEELETVRQVQRKMMKNVITCRENNELP